MYVRTPDDDGRAPDSDEELDEDIPTYETLRHAVIIHDSKGYLRTS